MDATISPDLTGLLVLNVLMLAFCTVAVLAVGVAVWLDLRERRQRRAQVPSCWPPPGVDPDEAYATPSSLARAVKPSRRARKELQR